MLGRILVCNKTCRLAPLVAVLLSFSDLGYAGSIDAGIVQGDGTPIQSAVISVRPKGQAPAIAAAGTRATMTQSGQQFRPYVLPIQAGTTVEFPNRDPFRHHVYSFSAAKTFELKLYDSSEAETMVFDKEGVIPLGCNIHDNMLAYIYVVGTPHFGQTGKDGKAAIEALPAGDYTVEAWHPDQRSSPKTADITVTAEGTVQVDFEMDLKRSRRRTPGEFDDTEY